MCACPSAQAGAQGLRRSVGCPWVPAFAGMTKERTGTKRLVRTTSRLSGAAPPDDGAANLCYSAAARVGVCAALSTAASLATRVPSKNPGFCVPHSRTALAKVKARKSSAVMWPSSTSS
jgi:hypothetical protein